MLNRIRVITLVMTIILVGTVGSFVSYYARGYRFNTQTLKFAPSGLFLVKSNPDGAQIFINGNLKTTTNTSLSLAPGIYNVSVRKDGYLTWEKRIEIQKEIVTEVNAMLFRSAPSLSAVTFSSIEIPLSSDESTNIAYIIPINNASNGDNSGLWIMETSNLPIGFSRDPRRVTDGDLSDSSWQWSPNGREILLSTATGDFLLDIGKFTPQRERINISATKEKFLLDWAKTRQKKLDAKLRGLPEQVVDLLARKASRISFSPDETKILYTASGSAQLAKELIKPFPGASTQKQDRTIESGHTYIYDIIEDRNFRINKSDDKSAIRWFITSEHLVEARAEKIIIMDYDGTNRQAVYEGNYVAPFALPTLSRERLLILTNLGANSSPPNLYSLNLR